MSNINSLGKICSILQESSSQTDFHNLTIGAFNATTLSANRWLTTTAKQAVSHSSHDMFDFEEPVIYTNFLKVCEKVDQIFDYNSADNIRPILIKWIYPILLLFGIVGNGLPLVLMVKIYKSKKKENRNFSLCLAVLCIADLSVLLFAGLLEYLDEVLHAKIRSYSDYTCKFYFFNVYLFSTFSSYLYGFIAFERWYAVSNPIEYKQIKMEKNKQIILYIFAYCCLISLPFLYYPSIVEAIVPRADSQLHFEDVCEKSYSSDVLLMALDAIFYCFIPFLITILFSILTLVKLVGARGSARDLPDNSTITTGTSQTYRRVINHPGLGN